MMNQSKACAKFRQLREVDKATVKEIDKNVKNKWSWKWQEEEIRKLSNGSDVKYKLKDCFRKIDVPGFAWCE